MRIKTCEACPEIIIYKNIGAAPKWCKKCKKEQQRQSLREWRKRNRDKRRVYNKRWRDRNHEQIKKYNREYYRSRRTKQKIEKAIKDQVQGP